MHEQSSKRSTERIINISNIYNIKQNSFNDNYTYIKSMNNSISSQKLLITQNSTCSSYLKSNKTLSNEENIITDIKPIRREANKSLLKNLCVSDFRINTYQNVSNLKKLVYKKKVINYCISLRGINNINTIKDKNKKYNKKINLISNEFSKRINTKEKNEFNDLTLDEYLKKEIKNMNKKDYNNNKENEKNQSINIINNKNKNKNNNINNKNKKSLLNNYITYNNYKSTSKNKLKQNKIKQKLCSKITNINLPKPKQTSKNKIISSLNDIGKTFRVKLNKKNNYNSFNHRKYNSFDGNMKKIFKSEKDLQTKTKLGAEKNNKLKIINLQIDLNDLIGENKNIPKKIFRFSRSTRKLNYNININNFTKDFFILPKLKKF